MPLVSSDLTGTECQNCLEAFVDDPTETPEPETTELVAEDLIEEVSIDGMCGVY